MNDKEIIEKWKEVIATANNEDPEYSFNLFKGLLEQERKETDLNEELRKITANGFIELEKKIDRFIEKLKKEFNLYITPVAYQNNKRAITPKDKYFLKKIDELKEEIFG